MLAGANEGVKSLAERSAMKRTRYPECSRVDVDKGLESAVSGPATSTPFYVRIRLLQNIIPAQPTLSFAPTPGFL